ncbi:MAG: hypothetical protein WC261_04490 [Synergistaceae bacterium]
MIKDLGPCEVYFNSTSLGKTKGGVTFRYTEESKPVNEDQAGVTNVDEVGVGVSACEVEVPLSRSSLATLSTAVMGATVSLNKLSVYNKVGVSMYDNAEQLILKPIVNGVASSDSKDWLVIPKACPKADLEVVFDAENQRVYKIVFKGFPDASSKLIWYMGA